MQSLGKDINCNFALQNSKRALRVVSIAHSAFPDGSGRLRYAPFAKDRDVQLTLVIPDRWSEADCRFELGERSIGVEVRIMRVHLPSVPKVNWYLHFYPEMGKLLDDLKPDVLHLWEEPWSVVATQAAFLCQSRGIALVLETDQNIQRSLPFPFQQLRRYTLGRTDLLIARQEEALNVSRAWGYKGPSTFVAYVVDQTHFKPLDRHAAKASFDIEGFTIGYVGRLIRAKGLFTVLDALKACNENVNFVMMGGGTASDELNKRIQEFGLGDRVRILSPQPQARVAEFMNSVDALVLMSETTRTWKEQFGRVIIEAQACGVPVIGSSSGSIPEVIAQGGWVVNEGNSLQLATLLDDLASDPSQVTEASLKALDNSKRFSPEIVSGSLRAAWFEAAHSKRTSTSLISSRTISSVQEAADPAYPYQPAGSPHVVTRLSEKQARSPHTPLDSLTKVIVIHETNGRKYLEALTMLRNESIISSLTFVGASVVWKFAHSLIRERAGFLLAVRQSTRNLLFRLHFWRLRSHTIILAVAPWDYRFLLYSTLRHRNRLIYNTSWPYWDSYQVPRRFGFLTPLLRSQWLRLLSNRKLELVAVTSPAAESITAVLGGSKKPTVIPHLVSNEFFAYRAQHAIPFRLLFVGELSNKKGVALLVELLDAIQDLPVTLDIVGDGPLRTMARQIAKRPGCHWHGHVPDRLRLAKITAECQVVIALGLRTSRWEEFFGMSILEAMACGVPCIASDHTGPRSFVKSGRNGVLVPERAIQETANWVRKLVQDPEAWQAMSNEAVLTAGQYSASEVSSRWRQVLTQ